MFKKLLIKMVKKDKGLCLDFAREVVGENKALFIRELIGDSKVYSKLHVDNEEFESINNCIILDSKFEKCVIRNMNQNLIDRAVFELNCFEDKITIKE